VVNIDQYEHSTTGVDLTDDRVTQVENKEQEQTVVSRVELTDNDICTIQNLLLKGKRKTIWESKSKDEIKEHFSTANSMKCFTDAELKELLTYLNVKLK
jgi:hypothetical protein